MDITKQLSLETQVRTQSLLAVLHILNGRAYKMHMMEANTASSRYPTSLSADASNKELCDRLMNFN